MQDLLAIWISLNKLHRFKATNPTGGKTESTNAAE
jgi:hypothetical protein